MRIVTSFCGAGGSCTGMEEATGHKVMAAINHDPAAIYMHQLNHPTTRHFLNDVRKVNPTDVAQGGPVNLFWASPDCTFFSVAAGGKPVVKEIRDLPWTVIRWSSAMHADVVMVENVPELVHWSPVLPKLDDKGNHIQDKRGRKLWVPDPEKRGESFKRWIAAFKKAGYVVEWRILRASDFGVPTIRKRLYLIARRDGKPIVWPEPTHVPRKDFKPGGLPAWKPAHSIIDWSIPCTSIFGRKRPLADNTLRRIAHGVVKYVLNSKEPFIMRIGQTSARPSSKTWSLHQPLSTITTKNEHCLVEPQFVKAGPGGDPQVVAAFIARHFGGMNARDIQEPYPTITTKGCQNQLVVASLEKMYGTASGADIREPLHTVTASGGKRALIATFLTKYYKDAEQNQSIEDPVHTIPTKARFGLVMVEIDGDTYVVTDIAMRMLKPHELAAAQGFPEGYQFVGSQAEQIAKIGNSVCPPMAKALVQANYPQFV